ncbi:hypothetical protein [Pleurocapsa sp. PCC 7319]|uniref:hypothetical protein n=1 Tax=Pleurocapsa sp. PCC 7319 TaxID=118161 RepID=UPI000347608F|nr:hypothetical protein [Pleurocapsa sp. PCC 7319]
MKLIVPTQVINSWKNCFTVIVSSLTNLAFDSYQPKILTKSDRHGNKYFQVYDPQTRQHSSFASEQEVRFWLDQKYSQL